MTSNSIAELDAISNDLFADVLTLEAEFAAVDTKAGRKTAAYRPAFLALRDARDAHEAACRAYREAKAAERNARNQAEAAAYWAGSISGRGPRADITHTAYTAEAIQLQLQSAQSWWNDHAHDPKYNYDDNERAEMIQEIAELTTLADSAFA